VPPRPGGGQRGNLVSVIALVLGALAVLIAFIPFAGIPLGALFGVAAIILGIIGILKSHKIMAIIAIVLAVLAAPVAITMTTLVVAVHDRHDRGSVDDDSRPPAGRDENVLNGTGSGKSDDITLDGDYSVTYEVSGNKKAPRGGGFSFKVDLYEAGESKPDRALFRTRAADGSGQITLGNVDSDDYHIKVTTHGDGAKWKVIFLRM
jgi:uncharacterized membrane protein